MFTAPLKRYRSALIIGILLLVALGVFLYTKAPTTAPERGQETVSEMRERFSSLIRHDGPARAYEKVKQENNGIEFDFAHNAAHLFGEALYETKGLSGVTTCDADMNFGCFHGFFSRAVKNEGLAVVTKLDDECYRQDGSGEALACQHGIGHGILEFLSSAKLSEALEACELARREDPIAGCSSGVFMEYNVPLSGGDNELFSLTPRPLVDSSRPYDPCPEISDAFSASCYYGLPQWWNQVLDGDFKKMGALCAEVEGLIEKSACIEGIGNIAASSGGYEVEATRAICSLMPDAESRSSCIVIASWSFVSNINNKEAGVALCEAALPSDRPRCPL